MGFSRQDYWTGLPFHSSGALPDPRIKLRSPALQTDWVASLIAQLVKNSPAMQETPVRFLGQEDLPEKGTATLSSIPAWRIPCTEEPGELQSMGSQRVRHN